MTVGAKIKRVRLLRGLTQKELGAKVGLNGATISKYEQSKTQIRFPLGVLESIATALSCSVAYLTDGEDSYPGKDEKELSSIEGLLSQAIKLNLDGYTISGTFTFKIEKTK